MSTISITRRPVPVAATAAAVAVLAFAGVTVAQGHHDSPGGVPAQQTQHHGAFDPTTSGGRIQLSLP